MAEEPKDPSYGPTGPRWSAGNDDGREGLALAAGMVAAAAGGLVWAGIVLTTKYEIGWVAWGIGALVGMAMARVTTRRSRAFGLTAAGLAAAGLLLGKLVISMGSAGAIAEELVKSPEYLQNAVAWQMYEAEELDEETSAGVAATIEAGDTLSDALWETMSAQAAARLAALTEDERRALARRSADGYVQQLGVLGGILVQLGPWDLLWFGLALATAYGMVAAEKKEGAAAPA